MMPLIVKKQAPIPPPSYQRAQTRLSPALHIDALTHAHDASFAKRLLEGVVRLYQIQPRVVRLDAAYWGLSLIT